MFGVYAQPCNLHFCLADDRGYRERDFVFDAFLSSRITSDRVSIFGQRHKPSSVLTGLSAEYNLPAITSDIPPSKRNLSNCQKSSIPN